MYKVPFQMGKGVLLHSAVEMEEEKQEPVLGLLIKARFGTGIPSCRHSAGRT